MKRCYSLVLCALLVASAAYASDPNVKDELNPTPGDSWNGITANCDISAYKSGVQTFTPPFAIPDNNPAGATVGPITHPNDGTLIGDVVIDLTLTHTWEGDIIAIVGYDENCDQVIDVQATVICRPGNTTCTSTGGVGCSSNFLNTALLIDDIAPAALPTTGCLSTTNIPSGCYRPTGVGAGPLSVFENHRKGGCWYLKISDNASLDSGTLSQWSVHILNQPTIATEAKTWGGMKVLFN
jgi:hypothetical protein